jgi:hypothetical protein
LVFPLIVDGAAGLIASLLWLLLQLRTSSKASDVELDVVVLTAGFWPANSIPPCILPPHVRCRRITCARSVACVHLM